jgi:hypothetical protein
MELLLAEEIELFLASFVHDLIDNYKRLLFVPT